LYLDSLGAWITLGYHFSENPAMAKPNYSFEKRQRELAKQKKQEEKRQKKQQSRPDDVPETATTSPDGVQVDLSQPN